jgi:septum formation protein
LAPQVVRPEVDERALEASAGNPTPTDLARRLAAAKAEEVAGRFPDRVTIGADQVLEIDGAILHKPIDLLEARDHLARLQGRTHALHAAVAVVADGKTQVFCETALLTMRALAPEAVDAYLGFAGEARVTESVGAYQLEGLGIHLFERIEGDQSTVLGLPLIPLLARLRGMGLLAIA